MKPDNANRRPIPTNRHEWLALLLFPARAFVVIAYPLHRLFRVFCPQPFLGTNVTDGTIYTIYGLYGACFVVLVLGAMIQFTVSKNEYAVRSLQFAMIPVLLYFLVFR